MKKAIITLCVVFICGWIMTRPNVFRPFSDYSAYDEGFKKAYGAYPSSCPSILCKKHSSGFWSGFFFKIIKINESRKL